MCGRYTVSKAQEVLAQYLNVKVSDDVLLPIYNASPGQSLPAILDVEPGRILPVFWGIKPGWSGQKSRLLINARSETVHQRPTFRESLRHRRCLVIADGFYEWQGTKEGKQPYRIALRTGEPFAFAGIWEEIDGTPSFVILTTDANAVTKAIHDRMPVILETRELQPWLDHELGVENVLKMLDPYPEDAMVAYRVSKAVNSSRNHDESLIEPVD